MTRLGLFSVCCCALVAGCGSNKVTGGPLKDPPGIGSSVTGGSAKAGQFLDIGVIPPRNDGKNEATLERLEPKDAAAAQDLELRYAVMELRPGGGCMIGSASGWPPKGPCARPLHRLQGYRYAPGKRIYFLVGARAHPPGQSSGHWLIKAFRLHYRVKGKSYATTYAQGLDFKVRGG